MTNEHKKLLKILWEALVDELEEERDDFLSTCGNVFNITYCGRKFKITVEDDGLDELLEQK